jgi:hypothetical protein
LGRRGLAAGAGGWADAATLERGSVMLQESCEVKPVHHASETGGGFSTCATRLPGAVGITTVKLRE